MKAVGIRELKNRLSEYLRYVRVGETVLVTDRGEVIAEIVTPGSRTFDGVPSEVLESLPAGLLQLAREGHVKLPTKKHDPSIYRQRPTGPYLSSKRVAELLDESRGEH
jgi:prevent-host-death family protein